MSINRFIFSGNLTRDPELRATASGMPVLSFGAAINERIKDKQTGEYVDKPCFVDCTMFGNYGESMSRYLYKGLKVACEGKLRYSQWEKDGQKRSKLDVIVDRIETMPKPDYQPPQQAPQGNVYQAQQQPVYGQQQQPVYGQQQAYQPTQQAPQVVSSVYEEDIPF